ncbi:MAG: hypothetical protein QOE52_3953 [Mycobacterium sp.]|jgi:hypothetical protein|nr:hypothetical protein [Mycobacterium sp.]
MTYSTLTSLDRFARFIAGLSFDLICDLLLGVIVAFRTVSVQFACRNRFGREETCNHPRLPLKTLVAHHGH